MWNTIKLYTTENRYNSQLPVGSSKNKLKNTSIVVRSRSSTLKLKVSNVVKEIKE